MGTLRLAVSFHALPTFDSSLTDPPPLSIISERGFLRRGPHTWVGDRLFKFSDCARCNIDQKEMQMRDVSSFGGDILPSQELATGGNAAITKDLPSGHQNPALPALMELRGTLTRPEPKL